MTELHDLARRFERWLDEAMPTLTPSNALDAPIDDLAGPGTTAQEQLDDAVALFQWVVANLSKKLAGKIVMLVVPLRTGDVFDASPPDWSLLASHLSRTPPSIHIMHVTAFVQAEPAERYKTGAVIPSLMGPGLAAYYRCWRNVDEAEKGWTRDVRVVSTAFVAAQPDAAKEPPFEQ